MVRLAVDKLGHLLAVGTSADAEVRDQVGRLAEAVQATTGATVNFVYVDQDYTGEKLAKAARELGTELQVFRLPEVRRRFVMMPRRWVVERYLVFATFFRCLVKDCKLYLSTLADPHTIAFACLMLKKATQAAATS